MRTRTLARWSAAAAALALLAGCGSTAASSGGEPPATLPATTAPAAPAQWQPGGAWTGPVPPDGLVAPVNTWQLKPWTSGMGYIVQDDVQFGVPLHFKIPPRLFDANKSAEAPEDLPPGQYVVPFEVVIRNQTGQDAPPVSPEVRSELQITGEAGSSGMWGQDGASVMDHTWTLHAGGIAVWYGLIGPATPAQLGMAHVTVQFVDFAGNKSSAELTEPLPALLPQAGKAWLEGIPGSGVKATAGADQKLVLYMVRGSRSRTDKSDTGAVDPVVTGFEEEMAHRMPQHTMIIGAVQYEAIPVHLIDNHTPTYPGDYRRSVNDGVARLRARVKSALAYSPHYYIGLVGYSQGAQVIREAFAQMSGAEQLRIAFIVTFGDPLWSSRQPQINRGDGNPALAGAYYASGQATPDVRIAPKLLPRVQDWCQAGDIVANWSPGNYARYGDSRHTSYPSSGYIPRAVGEAMNTYNALPAR